MGTACTAGVKDRRTAKHLGDIPGFTAKDLTYYFLEVNTTLEF
jgi:hypothetical protein